MYTNTTEPLNYCSDGNSEDRREYETPEIKELGRVDEMTHGDVSFIIE